VTGLLLRQTNGPRVSDAAGPKKVAAKNAINVAAKTLSFIYTPMDEQQFRDRADHALADLHRRISAASEDFDFESDFNAGALAIEFESPPGKFVVSPNTPVRQIWVSAHSKSFKLDWDEARDGFVLPASGQTLPELIAQAISQQIGEEVTL
jgi:iron donor protein CyaY